MHPSVTILIPHFKTLPLTKLCLQLLRHYTDLTVAKIVVIENGSQDGSLEYLRTIPWIEVIVRTGEAGESPVQSHARALDLGLAQVTTPYVLSIHTDTLVKRATWLPFLLQQIDAHPMVAGVGSWKLEWKPWYVRCLKYIETTVKQRGSREPVEQYLRSHCALYRTALLKQHHLHFSDGDQVAGKFIHTALCAKGYQMLFVEAGQLLKQMVHLNHATVVLNPSLSRRSQVEKDLARLRKRLSGISEAESFKMTL